MDRTTRQRRVGQAHRQEPRAAGTGGPRRRQGNARDHATGRSCPVAGTSARSPLLPPPADASCSGRADRIMTSDRVVLLLARVDLRLDRCTLALHRVRLDLGQVRLGRVPAAATATGPPPGNKMGTWDARTGGGARDHRGIRWSPVEQVKCGGSGDPRGTRWSPVEQDKVGRATRAHALAGTRLSLPARTCGCRTDGPVGTEMQAHAQHPMDPGGRGGVLSPRPTARRPPARASPVACRTADPVTAWSDPGRSRLRRELCRIMRCQAAALAGTVASGAPIVGDDMACPGLDRWPFPC